MRGQSVPEDVSGRCFQVWPPEFWCLPLALFGTGNYQSFGDTKFIPALSESAFLAIIAACSLKVTFGLVLQLVWNHG